MVKVALNAATPVPAMTTWVLLDRPWPTLVTTTGVAPSPVIELMLPVSWVRVQVGLAPAGPELLMLVLPWAPVMTIFWPVVRLVLRAVMTMEPALGLLTAAMAPLAGSSDGWTLALKLV